MVFRTGLYRGLPWTLVRNLALGHMAKPWKRYPRARPERLCFQARRPPLAALNFPENGPPPPSLINRLLRLSFTEGDKRHSAPLISVTVTKIKYLHHFSYLGLKTAS